MKTQGSEYVGINVQSREVCGMRKDKEVTPDRK